jgi:hypothetical protein
VGNNPASFSPEFPDWFLLDLCRLSDFIRHMKLLLWFSLFFRCVAGLLHAEVVGGPVTNSKNGHAYYLLGPSSWSVAESQAEQLGGTLAIIRDESEQQWVYHQFIKYHGTNLNLWIGLHRNPYDRKLRWVNGEKNDYANWAGGQPDDCQRAETAVFMASTNRPWNFGAGKWADYTDDGLVDGALPCGVVEVASEGNGRKLARTEKNLVGVWYAGGNENLPCYIAASATMLFSIQQERASRIFLLPKGELYLARDNAYGEVAGDKILWSNGSWWSRKISEHSRPVNELRVIY